MLMNFMLGFGVLGKIFSWIGNLLSCLGDIIKFFLFLIIWQPFMLILIILMALVTFAELTFKALAGINPVYLNGIRYSGASGGSGQDLVYAFITDGSVQNVFFSILALSFVLLLILTIVALIKAEFTLDLKGSAKGPIIARSLKSLANFLVVPVVSLISVLGVNFLTRTVYDLFGTGAGGTMAGKCLMLGLYNANNARNSRSFAAKLSNGDYIEENPFSGKSQTEIAALIDDCFAGKREAEIQFQEGITGGFNMFSGVGWHYSFGNFDDGYTNVAGLFAWVPTSKAKLGFESITALFFWYNIFKFDLIMPIGTALVMLYILLTTCLALVKRLFELTILFLLAPPMIAIAPLDGGAAEKRWRQEFMKRLLAVIAPVFAFNMYFLLVPLFENIKIFDLTALNISALSGVSAVGGTMSGAVMAVIVAFYVIFDILFQVIAIIVGLEVVRDASALLSSLMGVDDLVKSGGELGKKYMEKGKGAVKMGVTAATMLAGSGAFKGAATMLKGRATKMGNMFSKQGRAKNRLDKQIASEKKAGVYDENNKSEAVKAIESEIAEIQQEKQYKKEVSAENKQKKQEKRNTGKRADRRARIQMDRGLKFKNDKAAAKDEYEKAVKEHGVGSDEAVKAYAKYAKYGADNDQRSRELIQKSVDSSSFSRGAKSVFSHIAKPFTISSGFTKDLFGKFDKQAAFAKTKEAFLKPFQEGGDGGYRRVLDAMNGLMGDYGNTFFKPLWNDKARNDLLFYSVPESKQHDQDIQQKLWNTSNDKYRDEQNRIQQEKNTKNMIASMKANTQGNEGLQARLNDLTEAIRRANEMGDKEQVKKLEGDKVELYSQLGVDKTYKEYQEESKKGVTGPVTKALEGEKARLASQASADAIAEHMKDGSLKAAAENATKLKASLEGAKLSTKLDDSSATKIAAAMAEALRKNPAGKGQGDVEKVVSEVIKEQNGQFKEVVQALLDAIKELK